MDADYVKQALINVLIEIQSSSKLACPKLLGETKPIEDLGKFDSKVWPVASAMVAIALGVPIPNNINLFRKKAGKTPLTIDESVVLICALIDSKEAITGITVA
ncbi:MAG TPA: hypothetical protein VGV14_10985 [Rhodanobacter sp.]|nr:hypothetical protein [Rhodanobacter sp.]HEV2740740.1 hypothetical protein [Candidatus Elarobacter sp.]